ncbi:MAG: nitroreductase family protein [Candidatus Stygibacter frigidus]|nr:nitroreductase family protein [Candidatus Stygibacter frigidus]
MNNETMEILLNRASCRDFTDHKIEKDVLDNILEAGVHAPTGGNLQPFSIIIISDDEMKHNIVEMGNQKLIEKAPVSLLFCIDFHRNKRWAELEGAPYSAERSIQNFWIAFQDTIIAAQNICTAADSYGLGSVYLGTVMYHLVKLRNMLSLPEGVIPVVMVSMGYPASAKVIRKKLPLDVIVHREQYQEITDDELQAVYDEKNNNLKIEVTEEKLDTIREVCRNVHGEEYAQKTLDKIEKDGFINAAQRYFGLHYIANAALQSNEAFLDTLNELGMNWQHNYDPQNKFHLLSKKEAVDFTGAWKFDGDENICLIVFDKGRLILIEDEDSKTIFFAESMTEFFSMIGSMKITFHLNEIENKYKSFTLFYAGNQHFARRI